MRNRSAEAIALDLLISTLSAVEADYLQVLGEVLDDRRLTAEERDRVTGTAKRLGLTTPDRRRLHTSFLNQIALSLWANGINPKEAVDDLRRMATLLGLDEGLAVVAWESAGEAADDLGALPASPPAESTAVGGLNLGALAGKAATATSGAMALAARARNQSLLCVQCERHAMHNLAMEGEFPLRQWLQLAWAAKAFTPADFALNVARLAIQDRQLLEQTGRGMLPIYRCTECGTVSDRWAGAKVIAGLLSAP